jgi:GT2 family glycosyltransferase
MLIDRISIVILHWKKIQDTLECLESLKRQTFANFCVYIVNNSKDEDLRGILAAAHPSVETLETGANLGYAGGNNLALSKILDSVQVEQDPGWFLLLNNDTILAPDCLEQLVKQITNDRSGGILGPVVYHYDEPHIIQSAGGSCDKVWHFRHNGQNQMDTQQFNEPAMVLWLSGCALMINPAVFRDIGLFDDRFFNYLEELDFCLRAHKNGWPIIITPAAKIWHKGVQRDYHPPAYITYYGTRNRFLLLSKHRAPLIAWIVAWWEMLRSLVAMTFLPGKTDTISHRDAMFFGIRDYLHKKWGEMPL